MSSSDNFASALEFTLKWEGGFANVPGDHGGATMQGVTQRVYNAYRHVRGLALQSVRLISAVELRDIYLKQYWLPARCDQLAAPLATALFDFAVNSGAHTAAEFLQRIVAVPVDGYIGPQTLRAIAQHAPKDLAMKLISAREAFLRHFAEQPGEAKFLSGWLNRCEGLRGLVGKL